MVLNLAPTGSRAYLGYKDSASETFTPFGVGQKISSITISNNTRIEHTLGSRLPLYAIPMKYSGSISVETLLGYTTTVATDPNTGAAMVTYDVYSVDFLYEAFGVQPGTTGETYVEKEPSLYEIAYAMQKDSSTWIVHHVKEAVVNNVRLTARVDEAVSMTIDFDFADNTYYEIPTPASCSTTSTASGSDIYCNLKYNTDTTGMAPFVFYDAKIIPDATAPTPWSAQSIDLRLTPNNELAWTLGDRIASVYYGGKVEGRFSATVVASSSDPLVRALTDAASPPLSTGVQPTKPLEFANAEIRLGIPSGSYTRGGNPDSELKIQFKLLIDEVSHGLEVGELVTFDVSGFIYGSEIRVIAPQAHNLNIPPPTSS